MLTDPEQLPMQMNVRSIRGRIPKIASPQSNLSSSHIVCDNGKRPSYVREFFFRHYVRVPFASEAARLAAQL
jgi:hypothetical protein